MEGLFVSTQNEVLASLDIVQKKNKRLTVQICLKLTGMTISWQLGMKKANKCIEKSKENSTRA